MPLDERERNVAQASSPASSSTVPVQESERPSRSADKSGAKPGGETPPELAGGDARATLSGASQSGGGTAALHQKADPLVSGFHFRGVLPHLKKEGGTYFVTFRQAGTLPKEVLLRFKQERDAILRHAMAAKRPLTWHEQEELFHWYSDRVDKYLDAGNGLCYLREPAFADLVAGAMRFFDRQRYELRAWVVMPNHAHVVVWPMPGHTLSNILHSWKSFTSHKINERLPAKVVPFWQSESYEHLIRDDEDLRRCCHYTLVNPVNARLCARIEDWPWSSAPVAQAAPLAQAGHVAQASPPASSSTVSVRGFETLGQPSAKSGGGTPTELAGGDACATSPPLPASLHEP